MEDWRDGERNARWRRRDVHERKRRGEEREVEVWREKREGSWCVL